MPKIPVDDEPLSVSCRVRSQSSSRSSMHMEWRGGRLGHAWISSPMPPDGLVPLCFRLYRELFRVPGIGKSQFQAYPPCWAFLSRRVFCQYHIWCCLKAPRIVLTGWGRECGECLNYMPHTNPGYGWWFLLDAKSLDTPPIQVLPPDQRHKRGRPEARRHKSVTGPCSDNHAKARKTAHKEVGTPKGPTKKDTPQKPKAKRQKRAK